MASSIKNLHGSPSARLIAWGHRHIGGIAILALAVAALPAYLATAELQLIDIEFLASLCGIPGWGASGN